MAHYAYLDENNIVTQVIVGVDETELIEGLDPETWYGNFQGQPCKRTSYNNKIRKQFAGIGMKYEPEADVFIYLQPYPSWTLDENYDWQAPVPYPTDGAAYTWNEETITWDLTESEIEETNNG